MAHVYAPVFFIFIILFLVVGCLLGLSLVFGVSNPVPEKLSTYECGFNPFGDARSAFPVQFYVLSVLFILLDVELVLLFPLVLVYVHINLLSFISAGFFIALLGLTIAYEWSVGAFESF